MKRVLSKLLALSMAVAVFVAIPVTVNAAEAGTLVSNAIVLTDGIWKTKSWTNSNYDLNCYNKIVVPERGYVTFTASKPYDSEGEVGSYTLTLYNPSGKSVWETSTSAQKDSFAENYVYKIGLAAGTYYMNIDPSFYVYRNSAPITTSHMYTFTAASDWEIESNNNKNDATEVEMNKLYHGVYTEESYNTSYDDYFKIKLTAGKSYGVTLGNYNELKAGTLIEDMEDPYGKDVLVNGVDQGNARTWTVNAAYTDWYYIHLRNDGGGPGVEYTVMVHEHNYTQSVEVTKAATCDEGGEQRLHCACGSYKTEKLPATGVHTWSAWEVTSNADCESKGSQKRTCSVCSEYEYKDIPATGNHTWTLHEIEKKSCYSGWYEVYECTGCYGEKKVEITPTGHDFEEWYVYSQAQYGYDGAMYRSCRECYTSESETIYSPSKIVLNKSKYVYDGKVKKPAVKVYDSSGQLIDSTYYTVKYASGRKNVGSYKVTVVFNSSSKKYTGSMATAFQINPANPTIKAPKAAKKAVTVKWAKGKKAQVTGYEIMAATNNKFTKGKMKVTVKGYAKTSGKVTKLKAKTKYFVKVRAYKTVKGVKIYSGWSKVKTIKTK